MFQTPLHEMRTASFRCSEHLLLDISSIPQGLRSLYSKGLGLQMSCESTHTTHADHDEGYEGYRTEVRDSYEN